MIVSHTVGGAKNRRARSSHAATIAGTSDRLDSSTSCEAQKLNSERRSERVAKRCSRMRSSRLTAALYRFPFQHHLSFSVSSVSSVAEHHFPPPARRFVRTPPPRRSREVRRATFRVPHSSPLAIKEPAR